MIPVKSALQLEKLPKATLSLILANVLVYILEVIISRFFPGEVITWVIQNLGFGPESMNPISAFTAMFLHANLAHLAFNMLFLWVFGGPVEDRIGPGKFVLYYICAGLSSDFLDLIMKFYALKGIPSIGASGAISGIIALYLYRCFYSKVKMIISCIIFPRQINIPAAPFILLWFAQDFIMGIFSFNGETQTAYWGHVGGFLCGLLIGRLNRYGHEGQIEHLRAKVLKKLEEGGGWKGAEKELLKLLKLAPDDPEVNHDLARLYAQEKDLRSSERHYLTVIQKYFMKEETSLAGAYAVIEAAESLSRPLQSRYHVKAAEVLLAAGELEEMDRVLLPAINKAEKSAFGERALFLHIKFLRYQDKAEELFEKIGLFLEQYPESRNKAEIKGILALKPGQVFPAMQKKARPSPSSTAGGAFESKSMGVIDFIETYISDPAFWTILLLMNIAVPVLFPFFSGSLAPVIFLFASFGLTVLFRMGSTWEIWKSMTSPSENEARAYVDKKLSLQSAMTAEKRERFEEAAALFEQVLAADPEDIEARFKLARIYLSRLNKPEKAKKHFKALLNYLPKGHPYSLEASESLGKSAPDARSASTRDM